MSIPLFAPDPGEYIHPTDNSTNHTEFLSWVISKNLYNAKLAGYEIDVHSQADVETLMTEFASFQSGLSSWLSNAIGVSFTRDLPALVSNLPALVGTGINWLTKNPYWLMLAKTASEIAIIAAEYYFRADEAGEINTQSEIIKKALIDSEGVPIVDKVGSSVAGSTELMDMLKKLQGLLEEIADSDSVSELPGGIKIWHKTKITQF